MWWLTLATVLLTIALSFVSAYIPETAFGEFGSALFGESMLVIPCIFGIMILKRKCDDNESMSTRLGFCKFNPAILPILIFLPMAGQYFALYSTMHLSLILQILFGTTDASDIVPETAAGCVRILISLCIAAPLLEEILCRGIMMKMLERYGVAAEIIFSGLAFALLHISAQSIFVLFFLGMLLGAVKKMTGSIFPSMIMHAVNNGASFLMSIVTQNGVLSEENMLLPALLLLVMFPFLLVLLLKLCGKTDTGKFIYKPQIKTGVSAGLILSIAVCVLFNAFILFSRIKSGEFEDNLNNMFDVAPFAESEQVEEREF